MPALPELRFVSSNQHKLEEATTILAGIGIAVRSTPLKIEEIQTADPDKLVRDKLLKAFERVGRPLFVEHTGLGLDQLNGLPGGLTQLFWDSLQADKFATTFGRSEQSTASAHTTIVYCDGRKLYSFSGTLSGRIAPEPRGPRDFQWDCVFIPSGYEKTFAEMGSQKNEISMRRQALDKLAQFLKTGTYNA